MSHLSPGERLALHFGELAEADRARCATHAAACPACEAAVAELRALEGALAPGGDDAPPPDGLERVLARVEPLRPARRRRELGLRILVPSLLGAAASALAIHQGGLLGFAALFATGALVTLALAPVLILESQRRSS